MIQEVRSTTQEVLSMIVITKVVVLLSMIVGVHLTISYQSNNNKNNYNQQSTSSTTFIDNVIQKSDILRNSRLANSYQDSQQSSNFQDSQQSNNNMSSSYTNMSSSLNDSAFTSTTETTTSTNLDDNDDLPPDWIAIIDSDTGETYYANEVTGESTWEKPILHQSQQTIRSSR